MHLKTKKIKKGTVESKKRVSNRKREKKAADKKKGVKQQKHIQKKASRCPPELDRDVLRVGRRRRSRRGSSLSCSLPPFTPWVVIAGCCVLRVTARFQGRALCWRLEGSQLRSESLEGSCFSLSYRVGLGQVSPTPIANKKKNMGQTFCKSLLRY